LKKKLFLVLLSALLSGFMLAGCNVDDDDQNPPPPVNDEVDTPLDDDNNLDGNDNNDLNNTNTRNNNNNGLNNTNTRYNNNDINTDRDKDMMRDRNTPREEMIEDDRDAKDRDNRDR
jgi:hypothetical protein